MKEFLEWIETGKADAIQKKLESRSADPVFETHIGCGTA